MCYVVENSLLWKKPCEREKEGCSAPLRDKKEKKRKEEEKTPDLTRGGNSNDTALVFNDLSCCGATVHDKTGWVTNRGVWWAKKETVKVRVTKNY